MEAKSALALAVGARGRWWRLRRRRSARRIRKMEVVIQNLDAVEAAISSCAEAAKKGDLVVLLDFDRTITRCFLPDGRRVKSSHGILESTGILSEKFKQTAQELTQKYYPIEIDAELSIAEKIPLMTEWYGQVHEAMLKEEVTLESIKGTVAACEDIQIREGIVELLQSCQDATPPIPVLIMSAGLGDIIKEYFQRALPFPVAPTTKIVSNHMSFDASGRLVAFSEPLLHMFNKTAAFLPEDALQLASRASRCLVMGDSMGDSTMSEGLKAVPLKVAFLNEQVKERLPKFQESFDVVVTGDAPVPTLCFRALGFTAPPSAL